MSNPNAALNPNHSVLLTLPLRSLRKHKRGKSSASRHPHPLANDTTDVFQDLEDDADNESEYKWGMVNWMRLWWYDALMQHLYDTATFWGDKILSWTNDTNDAFWLAQTYFMTHQYARAERLLTQPFPTTPLKQPVSPTPPANGHLPGQPSKGKGHEYDALQLMLSMPRLPMGPGGMIELPEEIQDHVSRLVDMSVACRYLAALCQFWQGNWDSSMEMLEELNPFQKTVQDGVVIPNADAGIKVEASMCHLRGCLYQKLNRIAQAKQAFTEALALNVKCYKSFEQLIATEMMTPDKEWEFVQGLAYSTQTPQDAQFVQLIYTSRLQKYQHATEHAFTRQRLVDKYGLGNNPDTVL
ncbi:unnamed protein product [Cyclocybe aegerita]|uniref:Uncharacterized protein n=1 Tax=Cyclocybe aegerita TaxID=1973307 RepID=A0A8S0X2Y6_CYCAE|nr:unnamed protein product [Cyclocybe aegerita]